MEYIKRIPTKLEVNEYLITFEYKTVRGYSREQQRRIMHFNKAAAKESFIEWSKKVRTMTNVKILGIAMTNTEAKTIEI